MVLLLASAALFFLAQEAREPLALDKPYAAQGLLLCTSLEEAQKVIAAVDDGTGEATISAKHPGFPVLERALIAGTCAQFESWISFTPVAAREGGSTHFHLIEVTIGSEPPRTLFMISDRDVAPP